LSISLPIIFHGLSLSILSQSDRIILTSIAGATETGIYSLVYNFSMIVIVVITSIEGVWVPWFTKKMKTADFHEINQKVKLYIWIMTYIISCILLISPEILVLLAPKEYWIGRFIIPPIVVSSFIMFIYTIYVNVEHYYKKTKYIALNTIIAAFSNVVLNIIFIPMYGMYAAATTTLVSYFISLIMHYKYSRSIEKDLFPMKIILKPLLLLVLIVIEFYLMLIYPFIRWSILLIFTAKLILIWKKEIKSFIDVKN
jgi:O-antigen/teichoic acid export membrane protein